MDRLRFWMWIFKESEIAYLKTRKGQPGWLIYPYLKDTPVPGAFFDWMNVSYRAEWCRAGTDSEKNTPDTE